ncbi:Oleosin [Macleaya cordata]|uniref:Oleosin n=1 Tax=Macleaya cordata TaxID=56857 RepID=A0A200Q3L5_MACCD|nr:Oleosin [Macleaya cordata]
MADRSPGRRQTQTVTATTRTNGGYRSTTTTATATAGPVMGYLTLLISGGILLCFTGITLTATVVSLIFLMPLIIITSPIWVPVGTILLICAVGFMWMCGLGVGLFVGLPWIYKYLRGRHPPGSDRMDYARSRIAGTASQMRDYAREYGGYLQSKVKDVAPSA